MTETSVDPVESARREYVNAVNIREWSTHDRAAEDQERVESAFDRLRAAILSSDPRVQALEAVARAATAVPEIPEGELLAMNHVSVLLADAIEIRRALAALQEVTE